jgi:hypothetical protein
MIMKKLSITLTVLLLSLPLFAQDTENSEKPKVYEQRMQLDYEANNGNPIMFKDRSEIYIYYFYTTPEGEVYHTNLQLRRPTITDYALVTYFKTPPPPNIIQLQIGSRGASKTGKYSEKATKTNEQWTKKENKQRKKEGLNPYPVIRQYTNSFYASPYGGNEIMNIEVAGIDYNVIRTSFRINEAFYINIDFDDNTRQSFYFNKEDARLINKAIEQMEPRRLY